MHLRAGHMAASVAALALLAALSSDWYGSSRSVADRRGPVCGPETDRARQNPSTDDETDARVLAALDPARLAGARVRLERSACAARCAVYTVTLHGDGTVHYVGFENVEHVGLRSSRVPQAIARRVFARFLAARFFDTEPAPEPDLGPVPTYRLTLSLDGRSRAISFFAGTPALRRLAGLVDDATSSSRWTGLHPRGAHSTGI